MTTMENSEYQKMCSKCGEWKPLEQFEKGVRYVELSEDRYKELLRAEAWLRCLENAGVDNWEGISFAYEQAEAEGVFDEGKS